VVAGALAYGFHEASTNRDLFGERLRASFGAHSVSGRVEAGYRFATGLGMVTPYAAFQVTSLSLPAYRENGSGAGTFALSYQGQTRTQSRVELGARLEQTITLRDGTFSYGGGLGYAHYSGATSQVRAGFVSLPGSSFVTQGAVRDRNTALATVNVEREWTNGVGAALSLDGEFGQRTTSLGARARLSVRW
jgi:outer membrane autotransporter protein